MVKEGTKETGEMLVGMNEVALFLISVFKDGAQFSDFGVIWDKLTKDDKFKEVIEKAYSGYEKIPGEIQDLDLSESMDLAVLQLGYIPKFAELLKKG